MIVFPELAQDLKRALNAEGRPDLADQIDLLEIWSRCDCGDRFCASFYTGAKNRPESRILDSVRVDSEFTDVIDTFDGRIVYIEILFNGKIKSKLRELFSKGSS